MRKPHGINKRIVIAAVLVLASVFSIGCNTDHSQNNVNTETKESRFLYVDNGFSACNNGILYFTEPQLGSDKEPFIYAADINTGECLPLCAKPECLHNEKECNAYLDGQNGCNPLFAVSDSRLYWRGFKKEKNEVATVLYSLDLDGLMRKEEMVLDNELEEAMNVGFLGIYNGKLFRCGSGEEVRDSVPVYSVTVYSQELSENSEPKILFREEGYNAILSRMHENALYIACFSHGEERKLLILSYNMDDETLSELYSGNEYPGSAQGIFIVDDKIVFSGGRTAYSFSISEKSFETIWSEEGIMHLSEDHAFTSTSQSTYKCTDLAAGTDLTGEFPSECLDGRFKYCLGSINGVYYFLFEGNVKSKKSVFASYDPNENNFRVLAELP